MASADLLLHPIRFRVVQALLDGGELTTGELRARLADVPVATLYRHVGKLADGGVLTVVSETRVRGAVERRYKLDFANAVVGDDELRAMTVDEHRQAFTVFVATLLVHFNRYLDGPDVDVVRDRASFSQVALWLTDEELDQMRSEIVEAISNRLSHKSSPGRRRRMLTTILMPDL
ncbi:MAG: helix-turn-helix domain-containing protein [Mycobacterium sp.]